MSDSAARRWLAKTMKMKYNIKMNQKKQADDVKIRLGVQIDDVHFKTLLADAEIKNLKEYAKWNWDAITILIEGPLQNPRRLDDAIKNGKVLKSLLVFYRPSSHLFSEIKKGSVS